MADLDDFFAKKDKKKSKSKPKFLTPEELAKNLEDTSKRELAAKPKVTEPGALVTNPAAVTTTTNEPQPIDVESDEIKPPAAPPAAELVAEEEWNEFEEEQRKDYSGLKIGQMTLNEDGDHRNQQDNGDDDDGDNDGNHGAKESKQTGGVPWKKVIPAEEVTQIPMEIEKTSSKVYISPALRMSQGLNPGGPRLKMRNRAAPDITNSDYFPTLGAARPEEQRKKKNEPAFEEVRHGGRMQRIQEPTAAPVSIANRFQSLDDDDES